MVRPQKIIPMSLADKWENRQKNTPDQKKVVAGRELMPHTPHPHCCVLNYFYVFFAVLLKNSTLTTKGP